LSTTEKARQKGENEALRLLNPSLDFLLSRVPIFKSLPEKAILTLARHARRIPITEGQFIVRAGEPGHSLYVVVAGMLEVDLQNQTEVSRPKIFTGDFFGEISLILKQPRSASVIALTPSELIEIDENALNEAMSDFPQLRAEIEAVAKNRQLQ
ncbi:MAG: cyclic nucleotide-binding domain-containing protein, partial [Bdellovibrionales bacterium]|nr:cyclic nucleotide-binding domain-containing protein [Bdellovibrionales bacterium]